MIPRDEASGGGGGLSRGQFLQRAAAGGVALGVFAGDGRAAGRLLNVGQVSSSGDQPVQRFHSRPDLKPPVVTVLRPAAEVAPGHLFIAPSSGPGQRGVLIMDNAGEVIWFNRTSPRVSMNFRPAWYRGAPVLTWWEALPGKGFGDGEHVIFDASYRQIARFSAGERRWADLHEFRLTPYGTALVTALEIRRMDLRKAGGSKRGLVMGGVAQELEIPSARLLFEWRSLDHVSVEESYSPVGYPWDYFHINAVDVDDDGNLLVSARNTWAIYKISRKTGRVIWRLGGKKSDFALGRGARFAFQHDARHHSDTRLSVFDNGGAGRTQVEAQSRALMIKLDHQAMHATVVRQYTHEPPIFGRQMGNAQLLPNGNLLVGWGTDPHVTEFASDGAVRFDATLPRGGETYRAFRFPWVGQPADRPAVAAQADDAGAMLYACWNGATEVAAWQVESSRTSAGLRAIPAVPKQGFETTLRAPHGTSFARVVALDKGGRSLGRSATVRL